MIAKLDGRAFMLALFLFFGNTINALAHSLPGSNLTFSQQDESLKLFISFALEDLILAAPIFETLANSDFNQELPQKDLDQISAYLEKHLQLENESRELKLKLIQASINMSYHENIGEYALVVLHLSTPYSIDSKVFPLKLTYDAIMHEIRNHRAAVFWTYHDKNKEGSVRLANFGFRKVNGKQESQLLLSP